MRVKGTFRFEQAAGKKEEERVNTGRYGRRKGGKTEMKKKKTASWFEGGGRLLAWHKA